jgi:hypothetical protein
MDHVMLAEIGLRQLKDDGVDSELLTWSKLWVPPHAHITAEETVLNCATCHSNEDPHFQLFGQDCAQCHATDRWTIAEFRHPSPTSLDCVQCHQAPPSHYMMHFKMISMTIAGVEKAEVNQCFLCHQTTSWNDIKGIGFYKHH